MAPFLHMPFLLPATPPFFGVLYGPALWAVQPSKERSAGHWRPAQLEPAIKHPADEGREAGYTPQAPPILSLGSSPFERHHALYRTPLPFSRPPPSRPCSTTRPRCHGIGRSLLEQATARERERKGECPASTPRVSGPRAHHPEWNILFLLVDATSSTDPRGHTLQSKRSKPCYLSSRLRAPRGMSALVSFLMAARMARAQAPAHLLTINNRSCCQASCASSSPASSSVIDPCSGLETTGVSAKSSAPGDALTRKPKDESLSSPFEWIRKQA